MDYIYQDNKLYASLGKNNIVGVEIYSDKIVQVKGTETTLADVHDVLTKREVNCKFHIEETPYIFPQKKKEVKEVVEGESTGKTKTTVRKPTTK